MQPIIFTADDHLTHRTPQYRKDDYAQTMLGKTGFVFAESVRRDAPVVFAGDLFDRSSGPHWFLNAVLKKFMQHVTDCYAVIGNHDMSFYNPEISKSQFGTLVEAGVLRILRGCMLIGGAIVCGRSWGEPYPKHNSGPWDNSGLPHILVAHETVTRGEPPPWLTGYSAEKMIENNPGFDYIVTGDFHEKFMITHEGTTLINTGPLSRASIDKKDFQPSIWCISDDGVEEIPVPIEKDVFDLERAEQLKSVLEPSFDQDLVRSFIESLSISDRARPNFRQMVSNQLQGMQNKELKSIIEEIMDGTED